MLDGDKMCYKELHNLFNLREENGTNSLFPAFQIIRVREDIFIRNTLPPEEENDVTSNTRRLINNNDTDDGYVEIVVYENQFNNSD